MYDAVTKLLSTYGTTMDNKDHGKNLLHKLMLEGRISIREIEQPRNATIKWSSEGRGDDDCGAEVPGLWGERGVL